MNSTPTAPATICPGCDGPKSKRAELCATCRRKANRVGVSVVTQLHDVAAPESAPARPRTPEQNTVFHGRLREIALLEHGTPIIEKPALYKAERRLKRWAVDEIATRMFARRFESSTELTEIEMERLNEFLANRIDQLQEQRASVPA